MDPFRRLMRALAPVFALGKMKPSRRDMALDADEWKAKQKLGRAFFTRRLTPNSRAARVASLTDKEYELAKRRGWIRD